MGYRDDFFVVDNIVGYTGNLQDNPTVYFETDEEQAHITQAHKKADNVGRGVVFVIEGHSKENIYLEEDGAWHLVEMYDGKSVHTSRNAFVAVPNLSSRPQLKTILEKAIHKHKTIKTRYTKFQNRRNITVSKTKLAKKPVVAYTGQGRTRSGAFSSM